MRRYLRLIPIILLGILLAAGCTPLAAPAQSADTKAATAPNSTKAEWEVKWNNTLAEAKKEGKVRIYATYVPDVRVALTEAFKDKYGIDLEFTPFGKGTELFVKVQAEQNAGLYWVDVFGIGSTTLIGVMKPADLLGPLEPLLILPEVTDPKVWRGGNFPFVDKERLVIEFIAALQSYIVYNNTIIKEGEITTYKDVLKPQYKGKITMMDPGISGSGSSMFTHLALDLWSRNEAREFLEVLIKQQQVDIQRDKRLQLEAVSHGKFPIGLAPAADSLAQFMSLGAPLSRVSLKEGYRVSSGGGAIGVPKRLTNPNATAVFLNWLLTKEGQTAFVKGFRNPSYRIDVSTEGISPIFIPGPGDKIFQESEDKILMGNTLMEEARKMVSDANR